ncbi:MAG: hypothetical protein U0Z26_10805 [Anaerolineales bacterium]
MSSIKEDLNLTNHIVKDKKLTSPFLYISAIIVIIGYVWFITYGYWTIWNPSTYFYDHLATAFSHGGLALDDKVNPELLNLKNPYSPFERKGIKFPLDFSLYQGKYYLYFGPVPALLLVIPKLLGIGTVGDHILVFSFICLIFIFESMIILEIHKYFFQEFPNWLLAFCLLFVGLVSPIAWMLTEARVYEAAITAGQAFLLAGFYFNFTAILKNPISLWRLFIGGILWAFAFGSRLTLILPISLMSLTIFAFILKNAYPWKLDSKILIQIMSFSLPILIGGFFLGWYNYARFGSVFETGFYYQLTTKNLQKYVDVLFSPLYILPNSFEYLVAKPKFIREFPFLLPIRGRGLLHFPFITVPDVYYTRATTGIIYSTPFVIFAGLTLIPFVLQNMKKGEQTNLLNWIITVLFGSVLAGFATVASFFWVEARYFTDFSPSLVLLSIIGFFLGYRYLNRWSALQTGYLVLGISLILLSIINSNLLVLGIRTATYQDWNPVLWNQLYSFFTR